MSYFLISWLVVGIVSGLIMLFLLTHERDVLLSDFLVLVFFCPLFGYVLPIIIMHSYWDNFDFVVIKKRN